MPVCGDSFEFVLTAVVEGDTGAGDEVAHGLGDQHLVWVGESRDPGANVDGDAGDFAIGDLALASVNSGTDRHAQLTHLVDDRLRAANRPCRAVEAREEPIAGRVDLAASETRKSCSNPPMML